MSPSVVQLQLDAYLSLREALGFQMRAERTLLRDFVHFVESHGVGLPIRASLAVAWACAVSERRGPGGAAQRLSMARGFLTVLRATIPDTEVPDSALVASFRRPKPYLFTPDQIQTLMQDARQAGPSGALRPHTLSTLIGLLASTGLRVGEALRLTVTDVVLESAPPCLHIRATKFYKSRLVPLHPSTATSPAPLCLCPHGAALRWVVGRLLCRRARRTAASQCPLAVVYHAVSHVRHGGNGRRASPESQRLAPLLCG